MELTLLRYCNTNVQRRDFFKEKSSERKREARNLKLRFALRFQINALRALAVLTSARSVKSESTRPTLQIYIDARRKIVINVISTSLNASIHKTCFDHNSRHKKRIQLQQLDTLLDYYVHRHIRKISNM